jgi:hypothetical protein
MDVDSIMASIGAAGALIRTGVDLRELIRRPPSGRAFRSAAGEVGCPAVVVEVVVVGEYAVGSVLVRAGCHEDGCRG